MKLLNRGIYDAVEVARLLRVDPETVARWTTSRPSRSAILHPEAPPLFTFHDLISLYVVRELRRRGVSFDDIRRGAEYLSERLGTTRPFAHQGLATVGKAFFIELGGWLDAGKRGQTAFQEVILPLIKPIKYDTARMAAAWVPAPGVWIDPRVQAGAPCARGTRIPTAVISNLIESHEGVKDVALGLGLSTRQVRQALDFERSLEAA